MKKIVLGLLMMAAIPAAANEYICNEELRMHVDSMPATLSMEGQGKEYDLRIDLADMGMNKAEAAKIKTDVSPYTFW